MYLSILVSPAYDVSHSVSIYSTRLLIDIGFDPPSQVKQPTQPLPYLPHILFWWTRFKIDSLNRKRKDPTSKIVSITIRNCHFTDSRISGEHRSLITWTLG